MLLHQMLNKELNNEIAIRYGKKSITYKELREAIQKYQSYFKSMGIKAGDHVGLYYKNSTEFIYSYFAISELSAVVVPFNIMLKEQEIDYIANDSDMKHIVTMKKMEIDSKFTQIIIPEVQGDIEAIDPIQLEESTAGENDVATIIYTSGTTGYPKGAMLTHKNLISNALSCVDHFSINSEDVFLCVLPMFHSFAWTVCVLTPLIACGTIVILESFVPKEVLRKIEGDKVTVVTGVPTMYTYYLALATKERLDSVKLFISGGASLPVEVLNNFTTKFEKNICEGYGLSEASPVVCINPIDRIKSGSIGPSIPNVHIRIVDTQGNELAVNEPGELLVKGPNVMKGYNKLSEVSNKTIVDGWLHTGDIAYIDEDGYAFIVDRIKDIIIVSGLNVYPKEIEEVLYQYDGIKEAAVIGVPDKKRGNVTVAYIAVEDENEFDVSKLKVFLNTRMASFKMPKKIIIKEALPKNATGKIMKRILRDEWA